MKIFNAIYLVFLLILLGSYSFKTKAIPNDIAYLLYLGQDLSSYKSLGCLATKPGTSSSFANYVYGTDLISEYDIEKIKLLYNQTPFEWFIDKSQYDTIGRLLKKADFKFNRSIPLMKLDLNTVSEEEHNPLISIEEIKKFDKIKVYQWIETASIVANVSFSDLNIFKLFI